MTHHPKRALVSWAVGHFDCGSVVNWENGQSEAHIRGMAQGLSAPPLTHEEFGSLGNCAKGLMQRTIPAERKDRLIQLGYIQELSGELRLTNAGRLRIAEGE